MAPPSRTPAELVRELRGDLSHDKFAAALGTSRQTVIRWEKGTIPRAYAKALADYSRGRYKPEDFSPPGGGSLVETLAALEQRYAELEHRVRALEKKRHNAVGG